MADIFDYLSWRGDLSISASPFCDLDALVLSEFSYLPMQSVFTGGMNERLTIGEIAERFREEDVPEEIRFMTFEEDAELLRRMSRTARFRDMPVSGYADIIRPSKDLQFAAVTADTGDGCLFAAFRGTDGTVAGWKEDFTLSYKEHTGGQQCAESYVNTLFAGGTKGLRLGGHSKGGNLAVYAAAFCDPMIRQRICGVWAFDAPGFHEELTAAPEIRAITPRIRSFIPESSVVGMLLSGSEAEHTIVKSTSSGIRQHFIYSWELMGTHFVEAESISKSGALVNKAISGLLEEFDDDDRKSFTEAIFGVLEAPEKATLREIQRGRFSSYSVMLRAVRSMPEKQQNALRDGLKKLLKSAVKGQNN
ncbi:MAG: DUF2974 domain-containing protein [Ruminococcus sp.]|nr:DUF2974 domain-containing protein [Ruminococcus sp.]